MRCWAERLNVQLISLRVVHNSNKGMVNVCELWYVWLRFYGFCYMRRSYGARWPQWGQKSMYCLEECFDWVYWNKIILIIFEVVCNNFVIACALDIVFWTTCVGLSWEGEIAWQHRRIAIEYKFMNPNFCSIMVT